MPASIVGDAYRAVFRQFVLLCRRLELFGRELLAVDGTRIRAVNNEDRDYTRSSLREFIRVADVRLNEYLERLDRSDGGDGATHGGARTKNLAVSIGAEKSAVLSVAFWTTSAVGRPRFRTKAS